MRTYEHSKGFIRNFLAKPARNSLEISRNVHNLKNRYDVLGRLKKIMNKDTQNQQSASGASSTQQRNTLISKAEPTAPAGHRGVQPNSVCPLQSTSETSRTGNEESIWRQNNPGVQQMQFSDYAIRQYLNMQNYPPINYHPWNGVYDPFFRRQIESAYSVETGQGYSNVCFHRDETGKGKDAGKEKNAKKNYRTQESISRLRSWETAKTNWKVPQKQGFIFTLMTYNVLAQSLLEMHPYLYFEHDMDSLNWSIRWPNLFKEIFAANPDILCMQEVQESHIAEYYSQISKLGYENIYKARTSINVDGCAIYYKSDRLKLLEHATVEYYQPGVEILNRHNVAVIAKFAPLSNLQEEFVVATTHLLYNPKREDVRLAQVQVLLTEIERIAYKGTNESGQNEYLPVLITGDFNFTPDSAIYEFISKSFLEYHNLSSRSLERSGYNQMGMVLIPPHLGITDTCQHVDLLEKRKTNRNLSREEESDLIRLYHSGRTVKVVDQTSDSVHPLQATGALRHNFAFNSAYNHKKNGDNEGTTYQDRWITVDYIFYSGQWELGQIKEKKLRLLERYSLPTRLQLKNIRIPNYELGSDHLSLMVKFNLEY